MQIQILQADIDKFVIIYFLLMWEDCWFSLGFFHTFHIYLKAKKKKKNCKHLK